MSHPTHAARSGAILLALALSLAPAAEAWARQAGEPVPERQTLAFIGVNVVPMDSERVLENQTVIVRDGRIAAVGPSAEVSVPEGAVRIDAQGKYLMPGLAEMHGHLPGGNVPRELVENILFLYVANGVTLVRGMQGHPSQLGYRAEIERGTLLGPRLLLAGPGFGGANLEADAAASRVREQKEAGYDLLKIHEGLRPEVYSVVTATAKEVGIPFGGHVPDAVGLLGALEAGQVTVDHLDNFVEALIPADAGNVEALFGVADVADRADASRIPELVQAALRAGSAVVPTMVLWEVFFGGRPGEELRNEMPEVRYMPPQAVESWVRAVNQRNASMRDPAGGRRVLELRREILRALHQSGAKILLGTDSPQLFSVPGFSIHREMEFMVSVGMTPYEVLRSGTWNIAEHFGELETAGTVAPGKRADLILLEANPLQDVRNVARRAGVVVDGRWLPEAEIQRRLEAIAGSYSAE